MFKSTYYTILFCFLCSFIVSNSQAQSTPESCDCQLDTLGLSNYLASLTLNEQEPLLFSVANEDAQFAVLHGSINSSTPERAEELINNYPNVSTLVFMSIPGSGDDESNLKAARILREKGYISYLPAVNAYESDAFIASGGVDLFLSGTTRIIDEGGEVGVHSWADGNGQTATDFPVGNAVHQSYIDYYVEMGFSQADAEAFYYFTINAAPAAAIHNMTEAEIEQYKMRTCKRPDNCPIDGGETDTGGGDTDTGGGGNEGNNATKVGWTYLVYLNGSDLEQEEKGNSGTNDLAEMVAAGNTDKVNVIVTTGGTNKPGWKEIKRWKIDNGQQVPIDFTAADNDMANTQNLTDFIDWAITTYPAEKYVLDLWNHGMDIRGYGHDENTDKEIKIPDLQAAIANSNFIKGGNRFEIIGFDACLMATIEVQSVVQSFGNYFVGSEETEPGHGWNYTPIIQAMNNESVTNGADLGKIIADNFLAQAKDMGTNTVTLSVTNLAQTNALIGVLEDLTNTIQSGGSELLRKVQQARSKAEEYSKSVQHPTESEDMVDIGDMMKKLKSAAPELSNQADAVLSVLNQAVTYNIKDDARPNATGISMFWPHNKLVDEAAVNRSFNEDYDPIDFSTTIKSFMKNDYAKNVMVDQTPPDGAFFEYGDGAIRSTASTSRSSGRWSAIKIPDSDDLEQVQVVLSSPSILAEEMAGDVLLLGATLPDVIEESNDGSGLVYAYEWDGLWLGINGYPAYIADIFEYSFDNEDGNERYFTRVKVLGILNPDEDAFGQDIIMSFVREGDEADFVLESIVPETYGENVMLTAKERISLKAGDRVQLLYEGFNTITDEEFYAIDEEAIFTIETGNQDLVLDFDELDYGEYVLGFQLLDYAQNDTILFDPNPFLLSTSVSETFANNNISMYPNPAEESIRIAYPDFVGKTYQVQVTNLNGQLLSSQLANSYLLDVDISSIPSGFYLVRLITANKIYSDKLIIQR